MSEKPLFFGLDHFRLGKIQVSGDPVTVRWAAAVLMQAHLDEVYGGKPVEPVPASNWQRESFRTRGRGRR